MIQVNISIDLKDGISPEPIVTAIQNILTQLTNNQTTINIREVDNPMSLSPISIGKLGESE